MTTARRIERLNDCVRCDGTGSYPTLTRQVCRRCHANADFTESSLTLFRFDIGGALFWLVAASEADARAALAEGNGYDSPAKMAEDLEEPEAVALARDSELAFRDEDGESKKKRVWEWINEVDPGVMVSTEW